MCLNYRLLKPKLYKQGCNASSQGVYWAAKAYWILQMTALSLQDFWMFIKQYREGNLGKDRDGIIYCGHSLCVCICVCLWPRKRKKRTRERKRENRSFSGNLRTGQVTWSRIQPLDWRQVKGKVRTIWEQKWFAEIFILYKRLWNQKP